MDVGRIVDTESIKKNVSNAAILRKYAATRYLTYLQNMPVSADTGYPHDGRADKDYYPHDGRADKDSYPQDRHNQYIMLRLSFSIDKLA